MKKLFYFFAFAALAFVGCNNDEPTPEPEVKASIEVKTAAEQLVVAHEGGEVTVEFSSALDWTAVNKENVSGVELDPPYGAAGENNALKVTVGANDTEGERTITIDLKSGDLVVPVAIKQLYEEPAPEPYINTNLSETREFWCAPQASTVTLEIDANVEYTVTLKNEEAAWITMSDNGEGVYTFSLEANPNPGYRSVVGTIACELYDEPVEFYIFQNGVAARAWVNEVRELAGYNASLPCDLAIYGDYLLVANGTNIFVLNAADGSLANTVALPEGVVANSIEVDEGGNILLCSTPVESIVTIYTTKSIDAAPAVLAKFHTGNAYGGGYGNIRVAGNIDTKAMVFIHVAGYWTESGNTTGFGVAYEVNNGAVALDANGWAQFTWVDLGYGTNTVTRGCLYPLGTSLTDGALFVGYPAPLVYCADASVRPCSWAEVSNLGSSFWMENYACIDTVEVGGKKIAGLVASCLFDYDQPDLVLVDITDPAAAVMLGNPYTFYDPTTETDDYAAAFLASAESADVVLVPADGEIKAYVADGIWGAVACVSYAVL